MENRRFQQKKKKSDIKKDYQFEIEKIKGDGNCFFSAVSKKIDENHKTIRNKVCSEMLKHKYELLSQYAISQSDIKQLCKDKIWNNNAGDLVPKYFAELYKVRLSIYQKTNNNFTLYNEYGKKNSKNINLLFSGNHYDLLLSPRQKLAKFCQRNKKKRADMYRQLEQMKKAQIESLKAQEYYRKNKQDLKIKENIRMNVKTLSRDKKRSKKKNTKFSDMAYPLPNGTQVRHNRSGVIGVYDELSGAVIIQNVPYYTPSAIAKEFDGYSTSGWKEGVIDVFIDNEWVPISERRKKEQKLSIGRTSITQSEDQDAGDIIVLQPMLSKVRNKSQTISEKFIDYLQKNLMSYLKEKKCTPIDTLFSFITFFEYRAVREEILDEKFFTNFKNSSNQVYFIPFYKYDDQEDFLSAGNPNIMAYIKMNKKIYLIVLNKHWEDLLDLKQRRLYDKDVIQERKFLSQKLENEFKDIKLEIVLAIELCF